MSILETIVKHKKEEVAQKKQLRKESELINSKLFDHKCLSLSNGIMSSEKEGIIAEFKRQSPSLPSIHYGADAEKITAAYMNAGASALSILTDEHFFGGNNHDLTKARSVTDIPLLRKEFIIDPYQVLEAKSIGADAILLIAEILTKQKIRELASISVETGMEVLLEVHTADQLVKYHDSILNIGVNNRNLATFVTDIHISLDIFPQLPSGAVRISESGLSNPATVALLKKTGFNGFLIGEHFMKTEDPGMTCAVFIENVKKLL